MSRRGFAVIVVLGILLAASVGARPGIYEYWKAGTKRSRSKADLPRHSRARQANPSAPAPSAAVVPPWTDAWFSDSTLVLRRIGEMTEAMTTPMIGQTYPLPRGGGFVCERTEGAGGVAPGGLACVLRCTGPELGGRRHNWFYAGDSSPVPTLDRARWVILAPSPAPRAPWRALFLAVADSLSRVLGRPAWAGADSAEATWYRNGQTTVMRLRGSPTGVDSLEIECVSGRLAEGDGRGTP